MSRTPTEEQKRKAEERVRRFLQVVAGLADVEEALAVLRELDSDGEQVTVDRAAIYPQGSIDGR